MGARNARAQGGCPPEHDSRLRDGLDDQGNDTQANRPGAGRNMSSISMEELGLALFAVYGRHSDEGKARAEWAGMSSGQREFWIKDAVRVRSIAVRVRPADAPDATQKMS